MADTGASGPYPLAEPGLWVERVGSKPFPAGVPALFLDRDGTINVDTGYPDDPAKMVLRDGIVPVPEEQLPVLLPDMKNYQPSGTGRSPLANSAPRHVVVVLGGTTHL